MVAAGFCAANRVAREFLLRAWSRRERFHLSRPGEIAWAGSAVLWIAEPRARRERRVAEERARYGARVCRCSAALPAARAVFSWRILHGRHGRLRDGAATERERRTGWHGRAVRYGGLVASKHVFEGGTRRVSGAAAVVSLAEFHAAWRGGQSEIFPREVEGSGEPHNDLEGRHRGDVQERRQERIRVSAVGARLGEQRPLFGGLQTAAVGRADRAFPAKGSIRCVPEVGRELYEVGDEGREDCRIAGLPGGHVARAVCAGIGEVIAAVAG